MLLSKKLAKQSERQPLVLPVLFLLCIWLARTSFEDNFITLLFAVAIIKVLRFQDRLRPKNETLMIPKLAGR
ncbi:MAG TPA: hypothetical protein VMF66_01275, partial [Candidatus Acidoferrum sp.]|nr:hypothetical protein [Candidatus Acidoferrum sp.]